MSWFYIHIAEHPTKSKQNVIPAVDWERNLCTIKWSGTVEKRVCTCKLLLTWATISCTKNTERSSQRHVLSLMSDMMGRVATVFVCISANIPHWIRLLVMSATRGLVQIRYALSVYACPKSHTLPPQKKNHVTLTRPHAIMAQYICRSDGECSLTLTRRYPDVQLKCRQIFISTRKNFSYNTAILTY